MRVYYECIWVSLKPEYLLMKKKIYLIILFSILYIYCIDLLTNFSINLSDKLMYIFYNEFSARLHPYNFLDNGQRASLLLSE